MLRKNGEKFESWHESLLLVLNCLLDVICNLKFMKSVSVAPYNSSFVSYYLQNLQKQHQSPSSSLRIYARKTKRSEESRLLDTSGLESRTPLDIPTSTLHMLQPYSLSRKEKKPYFILELYRSSDEVLSGVSLYKCTSLRRIIGEYARPPLPWHRQLQEFPVECHLPD